MSLMTDIAALVRNKLNEHRGLIDGKAESVHTHPPDQISGLSGASKYVGTNAAGTIGIHDLPAGGGNITIGGTGNRRWILTNDGSQTVKHYFEKMVITFNGLTYNGSITAHSIASPNGPGITSVLGCQVTPRIIDTTDSKEALVRVKGTGGGDIDNSIPFTLYTYNRATTSLQSWAGQINVYVHIFGI